MTDSGMDDLILRALALEVINAVKGVAWSQSGKVLCGKMFSQIKDLPAVNAVPVVRCKDCKHWWKVNELCTHQRHVHGTVCAHECKAMDYCSDGERRNSE